MFIKQWWYAVMLLVGSIFGLTAQENVMPVPGDEASCALVADDDDLELVDDCGLRSFDQDDYDTFCDQSIEQEMPCWQFWLTTIGSSLFAYSVSAKRYISLQVKQMYVWLKVKYESLSRIIMKRKQKRKLIGKKVRVRYA